MKMKLVAGLTISLVAGLYVGAMSASADDLINIGFAQVGHESDWRTASTKSCQDVFSEENGYNLSFVDCDNDEAAQKEAVRSFIEQEVDYIIIDPIIATGWDTVLTECEDAGIPVIVIDRTIDDSDKYVSWVGSNFKTEGLAAGEWLNPPVPPLRSDVPRASRKSLTEKDGPSLTSRPVTSPRLAARKLWSPTASPMKESSTLLSARMITKHSVL